jgi:predicted metal-dependent phosphoesterase TrpH
MDSAFGRYLQEGGPAFVPRAKVTPDEAICLIKSSGGVACCAHVGKLKRDNLVVEVLKLGVQALEVYHPDHTTADSRYYERFAAKRGLIATGGSDAQRFSQPAQWRYRIDHGRLLSGRRTSRRRGKFAPEHVLVNYGVETGISFAGFVQ